MKLLRCDFKVFRYMQNQQMSDFKSIKRKYGTVLQVLQPGGTATVNAFVAQLLKHISVKKYSLTVKTLTNTNEISYEEPLMVICHNYSRLGTDIDHATSGVEIVPGHALAVVVVHIKQRHTLSITMPTDNLTDKYQQCFTTLVDYAYTDEAKIYGCDMNRVGDEKMKKFMEQHFERSYVSSSLDIPKISMSVLVIGAAIGAFKRRDQMLGRMIGKMRLPYLMYISYNWLMENYTAEYIKWVQEYILQTSYSHFGHGFMFM